MDVRSITGLEMALHSIGCDIGTLELEPATVLAPEIEELITIQNRVNLLIARVKIQEQAA